MRTSGGSVDVRNSGGSADWRNSDGSGSSGGSAPGQRISSSTIDNLFRNSSELADLPQLTVDEELQTDGEDAADATVMRLSGGIGTQLKLEQRKEQETSPAHISAKSAASNPICVFTRHHTAGAGRKTNVRVQERPFSRVAWCESMQFHQAQAGPR